MSYYDDGSTDAEYIGTTCPTDGCPITSIGADCTGGGGGGSPPAPTCPGNKAPVTGLGNGGGGPTTSVGILTVSTTATTSTSGLPAPTDPCVTSSTNNTTLKVIFCGSLTEAEQTSILQTIAAFSTEDCPFRFLYAYFSKQSFTFCITAGNYNATSNVTNNSITFSTADAATPSFADLLEHEFFHFYQNSTYPGGIASYGLNASTGVASAGFVNIEFEQAVFNDIATGGRQAFAHGTPTQQNQYSNWIKGLTASGTVYPKLTAGSAAYTQFISNYNSFLIQYNAIPGNVNSSPITSLKPQALINLFNIVKPNC